ncbi:MAG TPA: hypothetical protein VEK73_16140 [Xanthobacteraceae bacterium]|nr:hypothetical protein [Xanthobacteraceae bacterium]
MPSIKLNGWQRIGIIASIIWAFGAGIYTHKADVERANFFANFAYKVCAYSKEVAHETDLSSCDQERKANIIAWMKGSDENVAFAALAPIPLGWFAAFILLYVGRAQVIGFRAVVPWATLNWAKKSFVVFCTFVSLISILFAIMVILNLYVDTQVPVALALRPKVMKFGEDSVIAEGTWTRSGPTQWSSIAFPLQTSRIRCNRQERRCMEAKASVSGNVLVSELLEYEVESWTGGSIVFRNDAPCASEVFTIDLNTEAVSGAGHTINENTAFCKMREDNEKYWNYLLSNGFDVYWAQRQKARPLLLRLIQTLFGN